MPQQRFILTYGAESETLSINPEGWSTNGQSWQRDKKYWGVFQSYTVDSFRFSRKSGGGGDFIYDAYLIDDLKTVMSVDVYDRNPQTDDYDLSYSGKLNFDKDKFKFDRDYVDIGFVQNSNVQDFITRDDIELNINQVTSIDGTTMNSFVSSPKSITFKKIDIYRDSETSGDYDDQYYFEESEPPDYGDPEGRFELAGTNVQLKYYASTIVINEVGNDLLALGGPVYSDRSSNIYENSSDFDVILTINEFNITSGNIRLRHWDAGAVERPTTTVKLYMRVFDGDDEIVTEDLISEYSYDWWDMTQVETGLRQITINPDITGIEGSQHTVPSEGKFTIVFDTTSTGFGGGSATQPCEIYSTLETELTFQEKSEGQSDNEIDCYFPHEAFTRLFQLITSEESTFYSEFFGRTDSEFITYDSNGQGSLDAITTGWNLRQFPNKPFTLSLSDLFKTFDSIYNLGCSYDQDNTRFFVEEKAEFFKSDHIMFDLGEVSELVISPYPDAYFNKIKGGFENKGEYESLNGIKEFESITNWATDQPVKETQNVRSVYHGDSIGMEFARRKTYSEYASEDTDYDDLTYIVRTDGSETLQGGTSLSGFAGIEQYYNIPLTPRENLIRWGNFLKSQYWREEEDFVIRFTKSTKAVNITYENQNGDIVDEFDNIQASEIPDIRLFNPQYYEFKGVFDLEKAASLNTDPHGIILFTFENVGYAGFVDEIQSEDYNRKATYKLIATEATQDVQKVFITPDDDALFMDDDNHLFM